MVSDLLNNPQGIYTSQALETILLAAIDSRNTVIVSDILSKAKGIYSNATLEKAFLISSKSTFSDASAGTYGNSTF
jgi:hypothetical protein